MGYRHHNYITKTATAINLKQATMTYPRIRLNTSGILELHVGIGDYILIETGSTETLKITYASNITTIEGGGVTGDDLTLKANTIDAYPLIKLNGNGSMQLRTSGAFNFYNGATECARLQAAGQLHLLECTTPTAVANFGAIYTKADNELYFQTGAGVEKTVTTV